MMSQRERVAEEIADAAYRYSDSAPLTCAATVYPKVLSLIVDAPIGSRVLDAGCGNGALARLLVERGYRVVGIDLSKSGVALARSVCPAARFEVLPADETMRKRLGESDFDVVVAVELIEHLYAPQSLLQGSLEALRPGGKLILSTPYHGYLKNLAISLAGRWDGHFQVREAGGHIKFWSKKTLSQSVYEAGFRDLRFRGAGRVPLLWRSMLLAARRPDPAVGSAA